MLDILFYVFSAITLIAAVLMILTPSAVNGAFCMIVAFLGTAALFVLLEAYFLAVVQVVVYAGAVMVLFLFIIMLLDVEKGEGATEFKDKLSTGASVIGCLLFAVLICSAFSGGHLPEPALSAVTENPEVFDGGIPFTTSSKSFGYSLFTKYMLPFQVAGFLLLAAMIGVIVVSKKHEVIEEPDNS
ncbi:MAG: NADH-quinone oxidoreductase subunit J [Lentimonas sp.]|jgi:NADH-quinone oxidoreductase subunit J